MQIQLSKLTPMEQAFVRAAVENWNDLMWTDDVDFKDNKTLGISKQQLSGVVSSLVQKGIIEVNGHKEWAGEFQFKGHDWQDNDNPPELV